MNAVKTLTEALENCNAARITTSVRNFGETGNNEGAQAAIMELAVLFNEVLEVAADSIGTGDESAPERLALLFLGAFDAARMLK